jgi:hypothetical protein
MMHDRACRCISRVDKRGGIDLSIAVRDNDSGHGGCLARQVLIQRSMRLEASGDCDEDNGGRTVMSQLAPAGLCVGSQLESWYVGALRLFTCWHKEPNHFRNRQGRIPPVP